MALYDVDGTATGTATVSGTAAVVLAFGDTLTGGSSADVPGILDVVPDEVLDGSSNVTGSVEILVNVSGLVQGSGEALDATVLDASGLIIGASPVTGDATRLLSVSGYSIGAGNFVVSVPEPIVGAAIVTAYMEVTKVPLPILEQPTVSLAFRWGYHFTRGDLQLQVLDGRGNPFGPVCVSYTLYQMQPGCALKQIGPSGRKPVNNGVGCYYVTGTAGECGQPGLWAVRWRYQRTFGAPAIEHDCYFRVVDSVSSPIPGDTLERYCKKGWD